MASRNGRHSMSPTVPPTSTSTTSRSGFFSATRKMRSLISLVTWGITCTVSPKNSPWRSFVRMDQYTWPVVKLLSRLRSMSMKRSEWSRSRSVSAPSSVTNTSPCCSGLMVPGSMLMYGSSLIMLSFRPRPFSSLPKDAPVMPFPRLDATPPLINTTLASRTILPALPTDRRAARRRPPDPCPALAPSRRCALHRLGRLDAHQARRVGQHRPDGAAQSQARLGELGVFTQHAAMRVERVERRRHFVGVPRQAVRFPAFRGQRHLVGELGQLIQKRPLGLVHQQARVGAPPARGRLRR